MNIIRKLINFYMKKTNPMKYAKRIGVNIGKNCRLIDSPHWGSEPWLITIGNHTEISFECTFITHDGATWVFREEERYKNVIKFGRINIGNDVFIGAKSTILPGVTIGDRSIVATGAVVSKSIPAGEVWGGVPAQFIMKTEDYAKKCLSNTPPHDNNKLQKYKREETLRLTK